MQVKNKWLNSFIAFSQHFVKDRHLPFTAYHPPKKYSMKHVAYFFCLFLFFGCSTSNYYLVRHAEKMDSSSDPDLAPAGVKRSEQLRDILMESEIDLLYATPYKRTQQTVKPLALALNKFVKTYDARTPFEFVEEMKKINGKNIVVAGHSNTVPKMVLYFTGDTVHIEHDEYYHLFLVKKRKSVFMEKYQLTVKKYGE